MNYFNAPDKVGVGLNYQPQLQPMLAAHQDYFDYLDICPLGLCRLELDGIASNSFKFDPIWLTDALGWAKKKSISLQGFGENGFQSRLTSFGAKMKLFDEFHCLRDFGWYSMPLRELIAAAKRGDIEYSPWSKIEEIVKTLADRYECPFAIDTADWGFQGSKNLKVGEFVERLNQIQTNTPAGLVLDLNDIFYRAIKEDEDPKFVLTQLDLSKLTSVRVSSKLLPVDPAVRETMLVNQGSLVSEDIWSTLEFLLQTAPMVNGVSLHFRQQDLMVLGHRGVRPELERAKALWNDYQNDLPTQKADWVNQ